MMKLKIFFLLLLQGICQWLGAQVNEAVQDSLENEHLAQMVTLSEVVVNNKLNVPSFIDRVKKDTTFYKAFKNLRMLSFSSLNNIVMKDKQGRQIASLNSKTHQTYRGGCRTMTREYENTTGDMADKNGGYNYYTAELYAGLFFTVGKVCGETNIVGSTGLNPKDKSGIEKRKEQLKMLFFNPGKKIPGIPLMGEKSNIFDPRIADLYDYIIDYVSYNGRNAYKFEIKAKEGLSGSDRNRIVYDKMTTWFNDRTFEIMGRTYDLSYNTGAYDFDVHMEVELTKVGRLLVPSVLRYIGNWDVIFKKRERGMFTATLFNFR
ncbi:hypothetical protein LL912_11120 [Niabella sp. CC-SYL272]|uniref:hypothetical protein n=1 Tax=Niabella agricola TaxID=2891571 RepID=UPI001F4032B1|nr:hypothetical protein [Niabella agricola]MCF3109332.1 hypothetical protein [Niabella agricola]